MSKTAIALIVVGGIISAWSLIDLAIGGSAPLTYIGVGLLAAGALIGRPKKTKQK